MITEIQYKNLDEAYSYFNKKLFDDELPDCLITLHRKNGAGGYYWHHKFMSRKNKDQISEIALNPDHFENQTDKDILSILVHEMVHLQQYHFFEPSRPGYHNREWGNLMKSVGLYPSDTGDFGGKETGQKMSHYIIDGGKFEITCGAFLLKGDKLHWNSTPKNSLSNETKKKSRLKYTCPSCLTNIWAKPNLNVKCGECNKKFIVEKDDE